jgi:hypothetical protein
VSIEPINDPVKSVKSRFRYAARTLLLCGLVPALIVAELSGLTMDDLRNDPDLTPKKLMARVSRFKFKLQAEVQCPEKFLAAETGDCDDFAVMAAQVLREKGFNPRLFAVRMPGLTHVVCYVGETGSYMDYNNRMYTKSLVKCKPAINDIADHVAKSFDSSWTTASEFIYTNRVKILVATVARAEKFSTPEIASKPSTNRPPARQLDITF